MSITAPWVSNSLSNASNTTSSANVNYSAAANGDVVWLVLALSDSQASNVTAPTGWVSAYQAVQGATGSQSTRLCVFRRVKQSSDTTVSVSWGTTCRYMVRAFSWPGVDTTSFAEGFTFTAHVLNDGSFPTGSSTPSGLGRWAVAVAVARSDVAGGSNITWTPDAALTERSDVNNNSGGAATWLAVQVADSNGSVTQASHSYTATASASANAGIAILFYLIPTTIDNAATDSASFSGVAALSAASSASDSATATDASSLTIGVFLSSTEQGTLTGSTATVNASLAGSDSAAVADASQFDPSNNGHDSATVTEAASRYIAPRSWTLTTPTVDENLWTQDALFGRYRLPRGVSLMVSGSTVTQTQYPNQEDLANYDKVYLGGHVYELNDAEADVIRAAGYGAYLS